MLMAMIRTDYIHQPTEHSTKEGCCLNWSSPLQPVTFKSFRQLKTDQIISAACVTGCVTTMSKLQLCWIKDECTTYSCVWRISRNLRLQTPVDGDEGKSSTGDKGAHERADEDCFETELKIILISNVCRIYGDDNRNDNNTKDQTLSPKYPRRGANAKAAMGVIPPWMWNSGFEIILSFYADHLLTSGQKVTTFSF